MATEDLRPITRTTSLGSGVGVTDFHKAMNDFSASANTMGQMGSKMAQAASNSFSEHMGYENGKNPSGNVLPAFTESQAHYNASYKAQSQATLGLQISELLTNGQFELKKLGTLTPESLESFNKNITNGAKPIFDMAPEGVKQNLENHFNNSMLQINGSLNTKMLGQQQAAKRAQQSSANNEATIAIYDSASALNLDGAMEQLQSVLDLNKANLANGVISGKEYASNNSQALLALHKGQYNGLASRARDVGKLEEFLFDLATNKPNELNYKEWEEIKKSVASNVKQADSLRKGEQQSILASMKLKDENQMLTQADILQVQKETTSAQFSTFMSQHNIRQTKVNKDRALTADITSNWSNPREFAKFKQPDITKAFDKSVANILTSHVDPVTNEPIYTQSQAEQAVIMSAGGPVKSYTDMVNKQLLSGNGEQMLEAGKAWANIHKNHPNNIPISKDAMATMIVFSDKLDSNNDPALSAEQANQIISAKTSDDKEFAANLVNDFGKANFKTNGQALGFALNLIGVNQKELNSPFEFGLQVQRKFNENLALTQSADAAKKLTKLEIGKVYGETKLNGKDQFVRFPVERTVGIPTSNSSAAIINADIAEQLSEQFAATNKMFEEGKSDFKFEITKRPDIKLALQAAKNLAELDETNPDEHEYWVALKKNMNVIKEFNNSGQIEMNQVYKDGHIVKHKISTKAGMFMSQSTDPSIPVVGGYDLLGTNEKGSTMPFVGATSATVNGFYYVPNQKVLGDVYFSLNPHPESAGETIQERFEKLKAKKQSQKDFSLAVAKQMTDPFTTAALARARASVEGE
jgi:hypothetical protein